MGTSRQTLILLIGLSVWAGAGWMSPTAVAGPALEFQTLPPGSVVSVLGQRVFDAGGDEIGLLVDVLVDVDGQPKAGVIDVGGFMGIGTRRVAIAWKLLRFSNKGGDVRIIEDLTHDETAAAPEYRGADGAVIVGGRMSARP